MKKRYLIGGFIGLAGAAVVARLLGRPKDVDWEKNRASVFNSEHSRFTELDGVRIHFQEAGQPDAPPIILIHGFCASTLVWSDVLLKLAAKGFRVIAPDLLGYGYSGKPRNGEYTILSQSKMIVSLMEQLGIERASLVGSSYGGAVAATVALNFPERVEQLVLVGAVTNNDPTRYLLMRLFGSPLLGDLVSPLLIGSRRLLRRRMKRVYDKHDRKLDERRVDARHLPLSASATHRAIIRTVRRWDADRIQREAHLITQPTLLLWGENDQDVPLHEGERLHRQINGSRLIIVRGCGHNPQEEFPYSFTEVVSDFCSQRARIPAPMELVSV